MPAGHDVDWRFSDVAVEGSTWPRRPSGQREGLSISTPIPSSSRSRPNSNDRSGRRRPAAPPRRPERPGRRWGSGPGRGPAGRRAPRTSAVRRSRPAVPPTAPRTNPSSRVTSRSICTSDSPIPSTARSSISYFRIRFGPGGGRPDRERPRVAEEELPVRPRHRLDPGAPVAGGRCLRHRDRAPRGRCRASGRPVRPCRARGCRASSPGRRAPRPPAASRRPRALRRPPAPRPRRRSGRRPGTTWGRDGLPMYQADARAAPCCGRRRRIR